MTRDAAKAWVRRAAFCATAIGLLDVVIWLVRDHSGASLFRSVGLLDAAVTLALAAGLWRASRLAAIAMLAYWIYSKVHMMVTTGYVVSPVAGLVLIGWLFFTAAWATFVLRGLSVRPADGNDPTDHHREQAA